MGVNMNNIISAIINLVENPKIKLIRKRSSHIQADYMGEALEEYIKDLFANTVSLEDGQVRNTALGMTFSYLGNQNNPPDAMLHGGDAIEIKKIENKNSALTLNSSYPKAKLFSDSPMISKACKECENWTVKDIIYAVGVLNKETQSLDSLAFVYGEDYCANKEVYEKLINSDLSDPLKVSNIYLNRSLWKMKNPFESFSYVYKTKVKGFDFMCIINTDKFQSEIVKKSAVPNTP